MNDIKTIFKKELVRFFKDKRLLITTLILPGLIIYVLYSIMGSTISGMFTGDESYTPIAYTENFPSMFNVAFDALEFDFRTTEDTTADEIKTSISEGTVDLYVIFPENFAEDVENYDTSKGSAPNIQIYYNSIETESSAAYSKLIAVLNAYENAICNKYDINAGGGTYDLASEKDVTGMIFSMILPLLIIMFLFSGCMAIAPESIAGEKERGTIATLLVTPMKRSSLALGKVFGLSVIALMSGISSFLGVALSLPKLLGSAADQIGGVLSYGVGDYFQLLAVILVTVLLLVSLISVVSAYSKSVKEATALIMPLMILIMLLGLSSMFLKSATTNLFLYLIPLFNSVQVMSGIFSFEPNLYALLITAVSNLCYVALLIVLLSKMFNSEKIMFSK